MGAEKGGFQMKHKKRLWASLVLLLFVLASCSETPDAVEYDDPSLPVDGEGDINNGTVPLTQEHFLQDLDYMLYVLENNFALFDVAYWARDVDIPAIVNNAYDDILNNPEMNVDEFYDSLFLHFHPLWPIGHFDIITPHRHNRLVRYFDPSRGLFSGSAAARLTYPHVLDFYEPRHPDGDIYDIFDDTPNVTTEIVEEGRIARLTVNSFVPTSVLEEREQIRSFFRDIHDYEHLIIDLRANRGGTPSYFYNDIMGLLLDEVVILKSYAFFVADGIYAEAYVSPNYGLWWQLSGAIPDFEELCSISEMLSENARLQFNHRDAERLDYGFPVHTTIRARRQLLFGTQPAFDGEIWLLTGPLMTSAAQLAAWASKESGFATLVGEITGGVYGGPRTLAALPNSGILFLFDVFYVTDVHGRPLEAGTIPHHFGQDGMDALETVLALIAEGRKDGTGGAMTGFYRGTDPVARGATSETNERNRRL